jgi:hypothetical protein
MNGELGAVATEMHPGIRLPSTLNETLAAILIVAEIWMVDLYIAVPDIVNPKKVEFSFTSVTLTRMFCVLAFAEPSTARTVNA